MKYLHLAALLLATPLLAAPLKVAVLDFETTAAGTAEARLSAAIPPSAIAEKGAQALGRQIVGHADFRLIDRRDLVRQLERMKSTDMGQSTPVRPSYLRAAQAVEADIVLRGTLASLSTARQTIQMGGNRTELENLSLRVQLEALDAIDGTVVALEEGVARESVRQTDSVQTQWGEDELITLLDKAIAQATPSLSRKIAAHRVQLEQRPRHRMTLRTTADPVLVELDGMLVGSTPLENFELYPGDHTLTLTKPGHQAISKKLLVDRDLQITVPMLRDQLSADEIKAIYEKGHISIFQGMSPNWIIQDIR